MAKQYGTKFADQVAELCMSKFLNLGKTGKPKEDTEWTLLACILQQYEGVLKVVSLGTGSKCIGISQLPRDGGVLHDSHAEVVARRAFLLYLLEQIERALKGENSVFEGKGGQYTLKDGVSFHFYTSHTPCGDASIFPKQEWAEDFGDQIQLSVVEEKNDKSGSPSNICNQFMTHPVNEFEKPTKRLKTGENICSESNRVANENESENIICQNILKLGCLSEPDIHRTGAKTVLGEETDPKLPGSNYQVTGALRTKPGRGDPTLSMSCSDKIFKWSILGVQGALLMHFLKNPIYLETITIGSCPFSHEAMKRSLLGRFEKKLEDIYLPEGFIINTPCVLLSSLVYPFSRIRITQISSNASKVMPSPTSLIWSNTAIHKEKHEVATNGRRHGITKKNIGTPKSCVSICRRSILWKVREVIKNNNFPIDGMTNAEDNLYGEIKAHAVKYYLAWGALKRHVLENWTVKPEFVKKFKV